MSLTKSDLWAPPAALANIKCFPATWSVRKHLEEDKDEDTSFIDDSKDALILASAVFTNQYMCQPTWTSTSMTADIDSFDSTALARFPITNTIWNRYNPDSTISGMSPTLLQSESAIQDINKRHEEGVPIYIVKSRHVRTEEGHILDPWLRSMNTFTKYYKVRLVGRKQIKVEANSCEEILCWEAKTTLDKQNVSLFIWEEIKLSYVRKITANNFIDGLTPDRIKTDKVYQL